MRAMTCVVAAPARAGQVDGRDVQQRDLGVGSSAAAASTHASHPPR